MKPGNPRSGADAQLLATLAAIGILIVSLLASMLVFAETPRTMAPADELLGVAGDRLSKNVFLPDQDFPPDTGDMSSPALVRLRSVPWVLETDFAAGGDGAIVLDWSAPTSYLRLYPTPGAARWTLEEVRGVRRRTLGTMWASTRDGTEVTVFRRRGSIEVDVGGRRLRVKRRSPSWMAKVGLEWSSGPKAISYFDVRHG